MEKPKKGDFFYVPNPCDKWLADCHIWIGNEFDERLFKLNMVCATVEEAKTKAEIMIKSIEIKQE